MYRMNRPLKQYDYNMSHNLTSRLSKQLSQDMSFDIRSVISDNLNYLLWKHLYCNILSEFLDHYRNGYDE
jgi:hypothetical protein